MKLSLSSLILVTMIFACPQAGAQVAFIREHITVSVSGTLCTLDADYYFKNSSARPASCSIFYPLINRKDLPYPDSILVLTDSIDAPTRLEKASEGILFYLSLRGKETRNVHVRYRQKTPAQKFEYILTSTKAWGKPLELAEFQIVVPDSLRLVSCTPAFDAKQKSEHEAVYLITRHDFLPASNLVVQWKEGTQ